MVVVLWQFLQVKFSSKKNLFKRKIIVKLEDIACIFCEEWSEPATYLFVICNLILGSFVLLNVFFSLGGMTKFRGGLT